MDKCKIIVLFIVFVPILTLAACSNDNNAVPSTADPGSSAPPPLQADENAVNTTPTSRPTVAVRSTESVDQESDTRATSSPVDDEEPTPANPQSGTPQTEGIGTMTTFQSELFSLSFQYPENWIIEEDVIAGLLVESSAGYVEEMLSDEGALVILVPRGAEELPGDDVTTKLASGILAYDLPSTADVRTPNATAIYDQQIAIAGFTDSENDLDGFFAAILRGDTVVFAFAAAGGERRAHYLPTVEAILSSVMLSAVGETSRS